MKASLELIRQSIERTKREVQDPVREWSSHSWTYRRYSSFITNSWVSTTAISDEANERLETLNKLYSEAIERGQT